VRLLRVNGLNTNRSVIKDISCTVCHKPVKTNQQGILCDCCLQWTHAKCARISNEEYFKLGHTDELWFCSTCLHNIFLFDHIADDDEFTMQLVTV